MKTQLTHIRPMMPPSTASETRTATMLWNQLKLFDQNRVYSNMSMAQQMNETIVATIGMNGFPLIESRFVF
jgi:hypothetical protein